LLSILVSKFGRQQYAPRYTGSESLRFDMGKVEKIEREIRELTREELAELREWFAAFDADAWDRQIEADTRAGKLDALAEEALKAYEAGKTKKL
jgi:hypothetical protein